MQGFYLKNPPNTKQVADHKTEEKKKSLLPSKKWWQEKRNQTTGNIIKWSDTKLWGHGKKLLYTLVDYTIQLHSTWKW